MLCHGLLVFSDAIKHWEKLLYLEGSLYFIFQSYTYVFSFGGEFSHCDDKKKPMQINVFFL
jgi:hypothetical protein